MKQKILLSILLAMAFSAMAGATESRLVTNRAPLVPSEYVELPLGSIKAEGWLKEMLLRQASGATGHMDELYPEVMGKRNGWLGGDGDQWERGPYWIDGLLPLAYILDDKGLKEKVRPWVEWILASQREDGFFGPSKDYPYEPGVQRDNSHDWWPRMVALKILQQYWSATGDGRVIDFMTRYFKYQLKTLPENPLGHWTFWATYRMCDNLQAVYWLYNITGDGFLLELGDLLHSQGFDFAEYFNTGGLRRFGSIHCVNLAQGLKEPAVYWQRTADRKYLDALEKGFSDMRLLHGQPQGMFGGDEGIHGAAPTQGAELCSVVELMYSLEKIVAITGDTRYADHLERIAFNALPTQISDDFMYKQYFQQPNQITASRVRGNFYEDDFHAHTDVVFGTRSGYACCYSNMHQGWPKFTQSLWFATADGGVAAMHYAPSEVTLNIAGRDVTIKETTSYPMSDVLTFSVSMKGRKSLRFPFRFRVPRWCREASLKVNGEIVGTAPDHGMIVLERDWKDGDVAELVLPMEVKVSRWYENSASVERGPLVYALPLSEKWEKKQFPEHEYAQFGKEYNEVTTTDKWNFGLLTRVVDNPSGQTEVTVDEKKVKSEYFWNLENAPVRIRVAAKEIPFWTEYGGMAGPIPFSVRSTDTPEQMVELVPYGCTTLRITEFPVVR